MAANPIEPTASWVEARRAELSALLDARMRPPGDGDPGRLVEAMRYSLLAPGKRIRPLLALAAAETVGPLDDDVRLACASVELIHCYSLIHDDLPAMDDDDFRRGRPSNHKAFGEATAILAGDALLTLAFEWIAEAGERRGRARALPPRRARAGPRRWRARHGARAGAGSRRAAPHDARGARAPARREDRRAVRGRAEDRRAAAGATPDAVPPSPASATPTASPSSTPTIWTTPTRPARRRGPRPAAGAGRRGLRRGRAVRSRGARLVDFARALLRR